MRRKVFLFVAAGLFLFSLVFPYWAVFMKAPTYPEKTLSIRVYAYKFEGDVREWERVGRLVGVKAVSEVFPKAIFYINPAVILILALLSLTAAWGKRWLIVAAIAPWLVLLLGAAWAQYSLYQFGHNLDPERPLRYIQPFTPPLIGIVTLGKIRTYHIPHLGSLLYIIGSLLLGFTLWREGQSK